MALTRRGILGAFLAAPAIVRASSLMPLGDPQLFTVVHSNVQPWDIDRIVAAINARMDARPNSDWVWTAEEVEAHKRAGGWPEYGHDGARMVPQLPRGELLLSHAV